MFCPANEAAKVEVNVRGWRDHLIEVAKHTCTPLHQLRVLIMDAMGPKGVPRTALHMAEGGVRPENMLVVSNSTPEVATMRASVEETPLRNLAVLQVDLLFSAVPGTYDLLILDTMSGIPKTMEMVHNVRTCMAPCAVCILGVTRKHNKTPLPMGAWEHICTTVDEEDLYPLLERAVNIQWVQHVLQQSMESKGFAPFWPMWGSMGEASYRAHQMMVYMPFSSQPATQETLLESWVHRGIPLLQGDPKLTADRAHVFRNMKTHRRRRKRKSQDPTPSFSSGPRKKAGQRWFYEGKRSCTY